MRGAKRSSAHSSTVSRLLALELDRELAGLQLVEQLRLLMPPPPRVRVALAGSSPASDAELLVAQPARERGERLALRRGRRASRAIEPSTAASSSSRRDAPEQRLADLRRPAPRPPRTKMSYACTALAVGVARRRALEAEVGDPVLRARVRAAVEVQPELGDLRRRSAPRGARSAGRGASSSRSTEKLQCGSPVQAIESAAHVVDRRAGSRCASSSATTLVDALVRHVGDDEVLLARDADVAADALGEVGDRDHLVARDRARGARARRCSASPCCFCACTPRWSRRLRASIGGSVKSSSVRPSRSSTRSRMPSGPMSSIMNLSRALTRETR